MRIIIMYLFLCLTNITQAQITINNEKLLINNGLYDISQDLGQTVGNNLFHTFESFNLNTGEIAQFSGSDSIQNIISRVIGGEPSLINGTLRSTIPNADFYFLNPYGIVFGESAQLDLQGSFHASTADYLKLSDGGEFHARFPERNILTTASIESFGFLTDNPATLSVENSQLSVLENKDFSLTAGNLSIINAQIKVPAGNIYLATTGEIAEFSNFKPSILQGNISISQQSLLETSGENSGSILIRSGQFIIDNSQLIAQTQGGQNGKVIDITANDIALRQGTQIDASVTGLGNGADIRLNVTESITGVSENDKAPNVISIYANAELNQEQNIEQNQTGNAGSITLNANNVDFKNSSIVSETRSTGDGADVYINARQKITLIGVGDIASKFNDFGIIGSRTYYKSEDAGKAGNLFLTAEQILAEKEYRFVLPTYGFSRAGSLFFKANQLSFNSILLADMTFGTGDAGLVSFDIDDTLSLYGSRIFNLSMGSGNAGTMQAKAKNINLENGSYFSSINRRAGNAGNIIIEVTDTLKMVGARNGISSGLATSSSPTLEGINAGNSGNISVKAGRLIMYDGANISNGSYSRLGFFAGAGGDIDIDVQGEIDIKGANPFGESQAGFASGIFARSLGVGDNSSPGGNIRLQAKSLKLTEGAVIASSTNNYSSSGTININVQDSIEMSGDASHIELLEPAIEQLNFLKSYSVDNLNQSTSGIYANSLDNNVQSGAAGNINLTAHTLKMSDKSRISTSSAGGGQAGHIHLTLNQLQIDKTAKIASESQFINQYQFANVEKRDDFLIKQGDIIEAANSNSGKINYYVNVGTHLIPTRIPNKSVTSIDELYQLSEKYSLLNGQIVEVKNEDNSQSGQYIYTHHHELELDTWQRMDQNVTTILETPQPIQSVRKDNDGYARTETLPNYRLGERIQILDMGNGKPAEFIYTNMIENDGENTHVDFVQINQFQFSSIEQLQVLPEQTAVEGEYPIATVKNTQQGLIGDFVYANNQWVRLNATRQISQITDINNLTLARTGNIANIGDSGNQTIYTGQKWIDLNTKYQTIDSTEDLAKINAKQGDLVKVVINEYPENYFYFNNQWIKQERGGDAGTIEINTNKLQMTIDSAITTEAVSGGGGGISLNADDMLYLNNSRISTSVREGAGSGGDLVLENMQFLLLHDAKLIAQADEGQGGSIRITAEQFIKNPNSLVSASSRLGIDGNVQISSPTETVSDDLFSLSKNFIRDVKIKDTCKSSVAGQLPTEFQSPLTLKVNMYRFSNNFIEDLIPSSAKYLNSAARLNACAF